MFAVQMKFWLLFFASINQLIIHVRCQGLLPTRAEQINLLNNVQEILEQIKSCARNEQNVMHESMKDDLELTIKRTVLLIRSLEELTLLRLSSHSNLVCTFDTKDNIEAITNATIVKVDNCQAVGLRDLVNNFKNQTNDTSSGIEAAEGFVDKLNQCSSCKGLAVLGCYKKIIQEEVVPTKTILSQSIEKFRLNHVTAVEMKTNFNNCIDQVIDHFRRQLSIALEAGLHCI